MNCRTLFLTVTLGLAVVLLGSLIPRPASSAELDWDDVKTFSGTVTFDRPGDVLIVGGTTKGPSSRSGQAQWTTTAGSGQLAKLSLTIDTNGGRWYGKGAHSRTSGGTIAVYVNEVLVHNVVCDTRGAYGDYWPRQAGAGSRGYATGPIDVSGKGIHGPALSVKLVTKPYTAIDVHSIEIATTEAR